MKEKRNEQRISSRGALTEDEGWVDLRKGLNDQGKVKRAQKNHSQTPSDTNKESSSIIPQQV
jgi:hypothetical protein